MTRSSGVCPGANSPKVSRGSSSRGSCSAENAKSLRLVLSFSLDVLFDPLRCLTVRNLHRRVLETIGGDAGECASDSTVQTDFDRANYVCHDSGAVGRVLYGEFEIDLEWNISPLSSLQVDVTNFLVLEMGDVIRWADSRRDVIRDETCDRRRLADPF